MTDLMETIKYLNADELRVLTVIAKRLLDGQKHYGKLNLQVDRRDFEKEANEEIADLLVYLSMERLRRCG